MCFGLENSGWEIEPVEGETGMAYMGIKDDEKIFLKKNTSPFLAALSIHGLTPRLRWTKRMSNGDIISAQEWCNGQSLERDQMASQRVAELVKTLQESEVLLTLLKKVGGQVCHPSDLLEDINPQAFESLGEVGSALINLYQQLSNQLPSYNPERYTVNHGDMSRKNWLLTDQDRLYLVDWDSAVISDPALDMGTILCHYVDQNDWSDWLAYCDYSLTEDLRERLTWYGRVSILKTIEKSLDHPRQRSMEEYINILNRLN